MRSTEAGMRRTHPGSSAAIQKGLFGFLRLFRGALLVEGLPGLLLRVLLLIHSLAHDHAPDCNTPSIAFNATGCTGLGSQPMNPAARVSSVVPCKGKSAMARSGTRRTQLARWVRNLPAS